MKPTGVEEGVLRDRQLQPHQQQLEQGDEEEAERAGEEDAAEVLVVGAGGELDPARAALAREAVDDQLGTWLLAHGTSPSSIRPTTRSWARLDVGFLLFDELLVGLRRDDLDRGPHRRVGLAGEGRRLALVDALLVGAEDDLVGLAGDGVALAGEVGDVPGVDDVGGEQFQLDRGVDRDHQLVIGEGAVGVVVAPQPLLAGRLDRQRLGLGGGEAGVAGGRRLPRLAGEDDAEDEDRGGEGGEHGADPELRPRRPPLAGRRRRRAGRGCGARRRSARR